MDESENDVPVLEENEVLDTEQVIDRIDKLARQFLNIEVKKTKRIQEWFKYGQDFIKEVEDNIERKGCSEQTAKRDLQVNMVEKAKEISISGYKIITLDAVKDSTKRAIRVWKLFDKIGSDKIWRVRKTSVRFITELKESERDQIVSYFKDNV